MVANSQVTDELVVYNHFMSFRSEGEPRARIDPEHFASLRKANRDIHSFSVPDSVPLNIEPTVVALDSSLIGYVLKVRDIQAQNDSKLQKDPKAETISIPRFDHNARQEYVSIVNARKASAIKPEGSGLGKILSRVLGGQRSRNQGRQPSNA